MLEPTLLTLGRATRTAILAALVFGLPLTALAEPAPPTQPDPEGETAAEATKGSETKDKPELSQPGIGEDGAEESQLGNPPEAALRAYRDPLTGEITTLPSPEKVDQMKPSEAAAMSRATEGLETFELQRGGSGVHLQGRFRNALIAHRHADGTFSASCVDHPEHAAEVLNAEPKTEPAAAAELEEM